MLLTKERREYGYLDDITGRHLRALVPVLVLMISKERNCGAPDTLAGDISVIHSISTLHQSLSSPNVIVDRPSGSRVMEARRRKRLLQRSLLSGTPEEGSEQHES